MGQLESLMKLSNNNKKEKKKFLMNLGYCF
jgi:hypothetical protein